MEKFRLPRKIKKSLKKTMWLYAPNEMGNRKMALPLRSQEDYTAVVKGIARQFPDPRNAKARRKEFREKLNKENYVSDDVLKVYVNDIFRKDLRLTSYNTLLLAKNNPCTTTAYFNFVNAYQLYEKGENSYVNICCMSVDWARELLKTKRK